MKKVAVVSLLMVLLLVSAATVVAGRRAAPSETNLTTYELDAIDSGWYADSGNHLPHLTNYLAGECYLPQCSQVVRHRNFFVFDLSAVSGEIFSATLTIENPPDGYNSADPSESWTAFKVTTPITSLVAGGSGLTSIYDDLGSGPTYGAASMNSASKLVDVPLTGAIPDIEAKSGNIFAVGGAVTTLDSAQNSEWVFGNSSGDLLVRKLKLTTYVPTDFNYVPAIMK